MSRRLVFLEVVRVCSEDVQIVMDLLVGEEILGNHWQLAEGVGADAVVRS